MEKVIVPKDVAHAIVGLRGVFSNSEDILTNLSLMERRYESGNDGWYGAIVNYCKVPEQRANYLRAVLNGYQIELTPEEAIKDLYEIHKSADYYNNGVRYGITETLDALGITIEGVNA